MRALQDLKHRMKHLETHQRRINSLPNLQTESMQKKTSFHLRETQASCLQIPLVLTSHLIKGVINSTQPICKSKQSKPFKTKIKTKKEPRRERNQTQTKTQAASRTRKTRGPSNKTCLKWAKTLTLTPCWNQWLLPWVKLKSSFHITSKGLHQQEHSSRRYSSLQAKSSPSPSRHPTSLTTWTPARVEEATSWSSQKEAQTTTQAQASTWDLLSSSAPQAAMKGSTSTLRSSCHLTSHWLSAQIKYTSS